MELCALVRRQAAAIRRLPALLADHGGAAATIVIVGAITPFALGPCAPEIAAEPIAQGAPPPCPEPPPPGASGGAQPPIRAMLPMQFHTYLSLSIRAAASLRARPGRPYPVTAALGACTAVQQRGWNRFQPRREVGTG
jgi:hypothetical protein